MHEVTFLYTLLGQQPASGFEPPTSSLGSWHSTTELRPHRLETPFQDHYRRFHRPVKPPSKRFVTLRYPIYTLRDISLPAKRQVCASFSTSAGEVDLPPSMIPLPMLVRQHSAARSAAGVVESLGHGAQPAARASNAIASGAVGRYPSELCGLTRL